MWISKKKLEKIIDERAQKILDYNFSIYGLRFYEIKGNGIFFYEDIQRFNVRERYKQLLDFLGIEEKTTLTIPEKTELVKKAKK